MVMVVLRVAREFDVVKFFVSKAGKARTARLVASGCCCACEEKFDGVRVVKHVCGMCKTCYNAARRAIRSGEKTQERYIRDGEMLPPAGGRPAKNKFTRGLSKGKGQS
jgi:ATP-dependent DNA ligase